MTGWARVMAAMMARVKKQVRSTFLVASVQLVVSARTKSAPTILLLGEGINLEVSPFGCLHLVHKI